MRLERKEAIMIASIVNIIHLAPSEKEQELLNVLAEHDVEIVNVHEEDDLLRNYIERRWSFYSNVYLSMFLSKTLDGLISVYGDEPIMFSCPCCLYKTLEKRGEYFICKVCFWEDGGGSEPDTFNSVNKMSLREAKENFKKFGAISSDVLKYLDDDRMFKYAASE